MAEQSHPTKRKTRVIKWESDRSAICGECDFEFDGPKCEMQARDHSRETGHITTLFLQIDIARGD